MPQKSSLQMSPQQMELDEAVSAARLSILKEFAGEDFTKDHPEFLGMIVLASAIFSLGLSVESVSANILFHSQSMDKLGGRDGPISDFTRQFCNATKHWYFLAEHFLKAYKEAHTAPAKGEPKA